MLVICLKVIKEEFIVDKVVIMTEIQTTQVYYMDIISIVQILIYCLKIIGGMNGVIVDFIKSL